MRYRNYTQLFFLSYKSICHNDSATKAPSHKGFNIILSRTFFSIFCFIFFGFFFAEYLGADDADFIQNH